MARPRSAPQGEALPRPMEWHWTVQEIALHHRMQPSAVIAAIERGDLKARKAGKAYQIPDSWYREWLEGSTVKSAEEVAAL